MNTDFILPFALDLLLKSSVILVLTWATLQIWNRCSAAQRSCIWCVAFALIALLPLTRLVAPHWVLSFSQTRTSVEPIPDVKSGESNAIVPDKIVSAPMAQTWTMPDGATLGLGIWLAGIFLLVAYRLLGAFLLHRCRLSSSPLQDEVERKMAVSIRTDFGITRPVDIRVSRSCLVPVTWGTWQPVVMLPVEALGWPHKWLESALRHEMGHVSNYDHLKRLVAFLTCAFYWPNPLVWLAAKQLHLAQEEASDNLVLRVGVSPQAYVTHLIDLIRLNAGRSALSIPAVAMARPSTLEGRLAAILDDTRNRRSSGPQLVMATVGLAIILGAAMGAAQLRAQSQTQPIPQSASPQSASPQSADDPFITRSDDESGQVMMRKLKSIIIDKVDFNKVDVAVALQFFAQKSKEFDPDKKGVNFVLQLPDASSPVMGTNGYPIHRQFTVLLENVPLDDLLGYVTQQTNLKCSIEGNTVYFRP